MKSLDFLSPPITLFHLERRTHTSKIGGLLVIMMSSLYIAYISYLFFHLITHSRITSIFYKKFEFEAGHYSFNSSSIFHFIQIYSTSNGGYFDRFESKYIRAFTTYTQTDIKITNLDLYDHWVYDLCENNKDDKDLDPSLFEHIVNFTNAVCIRYYYNSTLKKYFYMEEEGFIWPHLEHGLAQKDNIYLTTSVQACTNDSVINDIFGSCPPQKEIDEYLKKYNFLYMYFTDTQIDPTNYEIPIQHFFQTITTIIGNEKTFIESFIHYSPIKLKTNEGSLFGQMYENNSFCFDYNRKGTAENDKNSFILTQYYHLMQNNVQIYERKYYNVFDLLSEIGGVVQSIFYFFFWLNYIYNKYIIAYDTNSLFFAVKDNRGKNNNKNEKIKNIIHNINTLNKDNKLKSPIKKFESLRITTEKNSKLSLFNKNNKLEKINNENNISNFGQKGKDEPNKFCRLNSININKSLNFKTLIFPNNNKEYNEHNSSSSYLKDNSSLIIKKNSKIEIENIKKISDKMKKAFTGYIKKEEINKFWLTRESLAKIDHKKIELQDLIDNKKIKTIKHISFIKFLKDIIFENKKGSNYFLIKFRRHLLSEEHLFKSHVKTVLIEKQCKSTGNDDTTNVFECFNEL